MTRQVSALMSLEHNLWTYAYMRGWALVVDFVGGWFCWFWDVPGI